MEHLTKLRPDRDLQCYFERPSAIAAISGASESGFVVSGCWRQQFDWAVIEWNRDNVFEHPALRNLPDGDLSGLRLSYEDERSNCIPLDSTLFPTVDWPYLRIWTGSPETFHQVRLKDYATAVAGAYTPATVQFELQGTLTPGDYIELAWLDQHFNYQIASGDTAASAAAALAGVIASFEASTGVGATASGARITLTYSAAAGSNANRIGVYGMASGARTEVWSPAAAVFSGGTSPTRWKIELDFANLRDINGAIVPMSSVRKMRWTWAADRQAANFVRSEFAVAVTNWSVSGSGIQYRVAGRGSRRIEDDSPDAAYGGSWTEARGNYSGGSIRWTASQGALVTCSYLAGGTHTLLLGTRYAHAGASITVSVDGGAPMPIDLRLSGEDVLARVPLGEYAEGSHAIMVTHAGPAGSYFYFDFLEIAYASADLPEFAPLPRLTLATDWDTDHSLALAPERTAWLIRKLGFVGRANHYVGALWFYELARPEHQYASGTITFEGAPSWGATTRVSLGETTITHLNLIGDTAATIAKCFEQLINAGSSAVWASAAGAVLTITSRTMGMAGNGLAIGATGTSGFTATSSGSLSGGSDGRWITDLAASPRLNRAARDWSRAYFAALGAYGIDAAAAFSMELQHGDDRVEAGIAQRYSNGDPAWLSTPALQTNFGPESTAYWRQVHRDMAAVMVEAGMVPYLQFGEVQWWYFADEHSMPFYDAHTMAAFQAQFGRPLEIIPSQWSDPAAFAEECSFLPKLIGQFTDSIADFVRLSFPAARFEVLYPPDVNDTPLNRLINFPHEAWTAEKLECLKTENFTYTGNRDLDKARTSMEIPSQLGFPRSKRSHLVGIGEYTTPWPKEQRMAEGLQLESVVLFALDQFCLIGYGLPLARGARRARFLAG